MTAPLVTMKNVSFAYTEEPVLDHVSLDIQPGEFVGVIGPNGSGKTTLLKLLGGLLQGDSGSVGFRDQDLAHMKRKWIARSIAWVPQDPPMVFPFKVSEIVLMGRYPYLSPFTFEGEDDRAIARRAMEWTATLGLAERRFNEISGGEKQRVLVAGALAQEPELLLLDEPTASLDLKYQMEILNIMKRLNHEKGRTLVLAIHDLHLASKFCQRLVLLHQGRIVKDGPPERVLQKDILESVYGIRVKLIRDEADGSFLISPEA